MHVRDKPKYFGGVVRFSLKILMHRSWALALSILAMLLSLQFGQAAAQTFVASLTLGPGQVPLAAGIDTLHDFAYFGTGLATQPGSIIKVNLSTFSIVATLTMPFNVVSSVLVDSNNGFLYAGSSVNKTVVKISLASFSVVATTTAFDFNRGAVLDSVHGFAYYAGHGGFVTRIRLSDFTADGFLTLNTGSGKGSGLSYAANIDTAGGFAYFEAFNDAQVFKVRLSDFSFVTALNLPQNETPISASAIDTVNGFLYYGNTGSPANIYRIDLSNFEKVKTLALPTGQNLLAAAVIDVSRGSIFFSGSGPSAGLILKISLSTFTEMGTLTLPSGLNTPTVGATIDTTAGLAYFDFGPFAAPPPGSIVKIAE